VASGHQGPPPGQALEQLTASALRVGGRIADRLGSQVGVPGAERESEAAQTERRQSDEPLSKTAHVAREQIEERPDRSEQEHEGQEGYDRRASGTGIPDHPDRHQREADRQVHEQELARGVRARVQQHRDVAVPIERVERGGGTKGDCDHEEGPAHGSPHATREAAVRGRRIR